jgi:hypothetical protein
MKLRGNPWCTSSGVEVNSARLLVCAILGEMDAQGFDLVGSVDMSVGTSDQNRDCGFTTHLGLVGRGADERVQWILGSLGPGLE